MTPAKLTSIRKHLNLSIDAMAATIGLSRNTLGLYEKQSGDIPRIVELAALQLYYASVLKLPEPSV